MRQSLGVQISAKKILLKKTSGFKVRSQSLAFIECYVINAFIRGIALTGFNQPVLSYVGNQRFTGPVAQYASRRMAGKFTNPVAVRKRTKTSALYDGKIKESPEENEESNEKDGRKKQRPAGSNPPQATIRCVMSFSASSHEYDAVREGFAEFYHCFDIPLQSSFFSTNWYKLAKFLVQTGTNLYIFSRTLRPE
jgi:hypothetical protein